MTEFELKFQVPRERLAAVEAALQRGSVERTRLRATYFDTPDGALARGKLTLRLRQEGREHVQTAKGPGPTSAERLEHNVPIAAGAQRPVIELHAAHPVAQALRAALAGSDGELVPLFETDIVRRSRLVKAAGTAVEIALDQGRIRAGAASVPVLELEFELKEGSPEALVEVAQRWCEQHGLWLDPLTKAGAGRRLAEGMTEARAVMASEVRAARGTAPLLGAILDAALQQVLGNARELAAGTGGDAHVHQLRVGLRRLRSALRELASWADIDAVAAEVEEPLRALFTVLGEHRDRATLLPALREALESVDAPLAGWDAPLPDVGAAVREPALQVALLRLLALVQALSRGEDGGLKGARADAGERLRKLHRKTLRAGRHFAMLAPAERHRVRKRLKRLRYLGELVRPLFDGKDVDRYVASLKHLQDALGEYQDAAAGRRLFTQRAQEDARAWFAAGWLAAREERLAHACEKACRRLAREAQPFWK